MTKGVENKQMEKGNDQIALILLAAGDSRRFHGNKLLSQVEGKPMYHHILDQVDQLPADLFCQRIVVTQYQEILKEARLRGCQVVENRESHLGISHSIALGLQAIAGRTDAVCFCVCDQPWLKAETIECLVRGWNTSGKGLGCLTCQGETGNPALFSDRYYPELLALEGDTGGKKVMRNYPEDIYFLEVKQKQELVDIDTPEEGNPKTACHSKQDSL